MRRDGHLVAIASFPPVPVSISAISIIALCVAALLLFVPVAAYEETISFDGDPSTYNLTNCSRIIWYIDPSDGHIAPPSLHSGPIRNGGASCVEKRIDGPASINFWWKVDQDALRVGMLVFMIDDEVILQCTSTDWSSVDYAVASGKHRLSWVYRKLNSYPEFAGAGWIDDLRIVYPKEQEPEVIPENESCCNEMQSIREDIGRIDEGLSRLDTKMRGIDQKVGDLSSGQGTLDNRMKNIEENEDQSRWSIGNIYSRIEGLNNNDTRLERLIRDSNTLSGEGLRRLDARISEIDGKIANLSINQTAPDNLSWISENVIYISDQNTDLTDVINKNKNKIILLADGIYHTGRLNIATNNTYIRSLRKWGAVIDANNSSEGVLLDTVNNITLDSLAISNCRNGLHIENSTNCSFINNLLTNFTEIGILSKRSDHNTFILNTIVPLRDNNRQIGIKLNNCNNNKLLFNDIHIDRYDVYSRLYYLNFSKDNIIYVSNDGSIREIDARSDISCSFKDSTKFKCTITNTTQVVNFEPVSENTWEFLD